MEKKWSWSAVTLHSISLQKLLRVYKTILFSSVFPQRQLIYASLLVQLVWLCKNRMEGYFRYLELWVKEKYWSPKRCIFLNASQVNVGAKPTNLIAVPKATVILIKYWKGCQMKRDESLVNQFSMNLLQMFWGKIMDQDENIKECNQSGRKR